LAHPAFANLRGHFIDAQASPRGEGQIAVDYTCGAAVQAGLLACGGGGRMFPGSVVTNGRLEPPR
jgi:hypothetical protein